MRRVDVVPGARLADAPMRVDDRPLRTTPASDDPVGADAMLRQAHWLLRGVQRDGRVPSVDALHDWLEVFDRRDAVPADEATSPRCGWG